MIHVIPKCPHCEKAAELVRGDRIYPHRSDLFALWFWLCEPCDAWVGCHKNSADHSPFGGLANAETRKARISAHAAFDPLWKSGSMTRKAAYKFLADKMSLPVSETHISWFNAEQCRRVVEVLS